jgi:hypothetical protein
MRPSGAALNFKNGVHAGDGGTPLGVPGGGGMKNDDEGEGSRGRDVGGVGDAGGQDDRAVYVLKSNVCTVTLYRIFVV